MNVGGTLRAVAPWAAAAAGTAAVGGALSYGAIRIAGEGDGGTSGTYLGMLGGKAMVTGAIAGFGAQAVLSRIGTGSLGHGWRGMTMLPVAVAGAAVGGMIARAGLERRHQAEYDQSMQFVDETIGRTQDMFRAAGAPEAALARVPESYDRSFFNAQYAPPLGPFRNEITVGRNPDNGAPLAVDDVIAHEFSHKVIHALAPDLVGSFSGDARSMHESLADTFAMAVDTDDWTMGEDVRDGGIRSFSNPEVRGAIHGDDVTPAPITRDELKGAEAHLGAGVGNKAAWRIGDALGRDVMARIYVSALEHGNLGRNATYDQLATAVRSAATDLYGAGSNEATVVDDAWTKAGY